MIIVTLQGGLGNQMFQYACGKSAALQRNSYFRLDTRTLQKVNIDEHFTNRFFELNIFDAKISEASDKEFNRFFAKSILLKIWYKWLRGYNHYTEQTFFFDVALNLQRRSLFLLGYWQTEKYFIAYENDIRKDFIFSTPKNNDTLLYEKEILLCNAVSIHIRRGDYITSSTANSFHGVINLDYYEVAMQKIEKLVENPIYYLFSDDPAWAKVHIVKNRKDIVIIKHNIGKDNWQDMYLMSKCKHNIIANSSFSWWGAWLNENINKIVIAPKKWFANNEQNNQTQDLIPESWIKL